MKLYYKLILLALMLALVGPFFIKDQSGQPLWSLQKWYNQGKDHLQRYTKQVEQSISSDAIEPSGPSLYRYKDENGAWIYTDTKPDNQDAELITLTDSITEVKAFSLPKPKNQSETSQPATEQTTLKSPSQEDADIPTSSNPLTTAPLSEVPNTLKQIESIREQYRLRQQQIDNASQ
ncbi:hypothetical protein [Bermanella sp. R86510]|uniref:hypothetical protein n=1 Tax=unclassified Bermanella TaxID=2627862 RepID=UPI0037C6D16A